jgi:hypothetical protein
MRTSELYQRYIDKITAIAKASDASPDWKPAVASLVRQFHAETMSMARAPFRNACDEMAAEFEGKFNSYPDGHARDVFGYASELVRAL